MNSERGMTLIETLAALALLAMLTVVAANWLGLIGAVRASTVDQTRWRIAAEHALAAIADDVAGGDFALEQRQPEPHVTYEAATLTITTREPQIGATRTQWKLNGTRLQRSQADRSEMEPRDVLTKVESWNVEIDKRQSAALVTIIAVDGRIVERRIRLP